MSKEQLSDDVIASIKRAFMAGTPNTKNGSLHGVSRHTVRSYIEKYGWDEERAKIEEKASSKYVEKMSEIKASEQADVNSDHFNMLDLLRARLMDALEADDEERIKEVNQQVGAAEKLINLERAVKGLDLQQKLPKLNIPSAMRLTIVSPDGTVTTVNSNDVTDQQEAHLEAMLPNQNESSFGPISVQAVSVDDDDDDVILFEEPPKIASLDF